MNSVYALYQNLTAGIENAEVVDSLVSDSYKESPEATARVLFYTRDCRGGAGRRHSFRLAFQSLVKIDPEFAGKLVRHVPTYGRWDDMFHLGKEIEDVSFSVIKEALENGNGLAAKWMPREKSSRKYDAAKLRKFMGMSPKEYRKLLVSNTKVAETQFCANDWENLELSKMPSLCLTRNTEAIKRHVPEVFDSFIEGVKSGDVTSNLGNASPIELVRMVRSGKTERDVFDTYWCQMENTVPSDVRILPMIDVSGSMMAPASGSITCMDVAIALGTYLSWNSEGFFKNYAMSFSEVPRLFYSSPNNGPAAMVEAITSDDNVGYSTNFEAGLKTLLEKMVENNVSTEDAPEYILAFTDMQFNQCERSYSWFGGRERKKQASIVEAYPAISKAYEDAGYKAPQLIIWNIRGSFASPSNPDDKGVDILSVGDLNIYQVSGFEKSVFQNILSADFHSIDMSPVKLMEHVIYSPRYDMLFQ